MASRHGLQREISPTELGLNAADGLSAGTLNSNSFDCSGFNQFTHCNQTLLIAVG